MARRIRIIGDAEEWLAQVAAGGQVTFDDAGASADTAVVHDEGDGRFRVEGAAAYSGVAATAGDLVWVAIDGHVLRFAVRSGTEADASATRDQDALSAPMPATVVRIAVAPGERVREGDLLIVLEAMKMELPIRAPRDMVIGALHCREGEMVQPGRALID
jgi:biotin carboxyl carrier protein